ncbi:MAG UNVERIFIED_CONTAM: alpha-glucosidase C-terminal domain-containing protein [Anaerolineae bacterium]
MPSGKAHAAFGGNDTRFIPCENEHVLVYLRPHAQQPISCVANFSEHLCAFALESIRAHWQAPFSNYATCHRRSPQARG